MEALNKEVSTEYLSCNMNYTAIFTSVNYYENTVFMIRTNFGVPVRK